MTHPPMTGAAYLAQTFQAQGVTHVFYVDAILRKTLVELEKLGIRRVVTHSEKAAAYMADGYARISNRPAVCMAQSVGAANLAAALQDAFLAKSPLVAISGKKPPLFQQRNAYQEIEHAPLYAAVTKYHAEVWESAQLPHLLDQAFRESVTGAPGPAHLDVIGRMGRELEDAMIDPQAFYKTTYHLPFHRPEPSQEEISAAASALLAADRAVIVAGGGVRVSQAGAELIALAEHLNIPVVTTVSGKEIIPDAHRLYAGVVGGYGRWCANQVVAGADLVVYIGSQVGDQVTLDWCIPQAGTRIIQVDIDPAQPGRNYPNTLPVVGDARAALRSLKDALPASPGNPDWLQAVATWTADWWAQIDPLRNSDQNPIRPERLSKEINDWLPEDAVVVADTGYSAIWTATMLRLNGSGQSYLRAAGSLGWAFPASLGVKCAVPDRPVVCFCGDGAFWYHISELETALRHSIQTITIVNNNQGYSQGLDDILKVYEGQPGNARDLYEFYPVNLARVAQEIGAFGIRVEQAEEILPALRKAQESGRPAVIEVLTDTHYRTPPPVLKP